MGTPKNQGWMQILQIEHLLETGKKSLGDLLLRKLKVEVELHTGGTCVCLLAVDLPGQGFARGSTGPGISQPAYS